MASYSPLRLLDCFLLLAGASLGSSFIEGAGFEIEALLRDCLGLGAGFGGGGGVDDEATLGESAAKKTDGEGMVMVSAIGCSYPLARDAAEERSMRWRWADCK